MCIRRTLGSSACLTEESYEASMLRALPRCHRHRLIAVRRADGNGGNVNVRSKAFSVALLALASRPDHNDG